MEENYTKSERGRIGQMQKKIEKDNFEKKKRVELCLPESQTGTK